MKVAIVGFAGSGKSTCFRAIMQETEEKAEKLDPTKPHLGTQKVFDGRLEKLKSIFNPKRLTRAEILFEDLPGFHIPQIKDVDSIMEVVGVFSGRNPVRDIEDIDLEFMLADVSIIDKRLHSVEKEIRQEKSREKVLEKETLLKCKEALEKNTPLRYVEFTCDEEKSIRGFQFLSKKPLFIVGNTGDTKESAEFLPALERFCKEKKLSLVEFPAKLEAEITELEEEEKKEFLKELGADKRAGERVIEAACAGLGYITFFTAKGDETKAWLIKRGTHALEAAGKIHTDIERGFIKAEIINFDDLISCGSIPEARKKGLLKLEAKEYIIQDGDVVDFKFNV